MKNLFKKLMPTFLAASMPTVSFCQLKIQDLSSIKTEAEKGADATKEIALYFIGSVLVIALIFVVWEVASGKPNAKEHVIGWFIAVILVIIAGIIV